MMKQNCHFLKNITAGLLNPVMPLLISALLFTGLANGQDKESFSKKTRKIADRQKSILKNLKKSNWDATEKTFFQLFADNRIDSLTRLTTQNVFLNTESRKRLLNEEYIFLGILADALQKQRLSAPQLHEYCYTFTRLWLADYAGEAIPRHLVELSPELKGIMERIFQGTGSEDELSQALTAFKNMEKNYSGIMNFLASNPGYRFRDSLLFTYANTEPEKFIISVNSNKDDSLRKIIQAHPSPVVQTLLAISREKNYSNYVPFVRLIAENKITLAAIDNVRNNPANYFQLMVNSAVADAGEVMAGRTPAYALPLQNYVKAYAKTFYTDIINNLHEEADKTRFAVLEGLRPQDLYEIIVSGENDLYTSSYLYTFKKLMAGFEPDRYDQVLTLVNYDRYRTFMMLAGRYNKLNALFAGMNKEASAKILSSFISGLEKNKENPLEEAVTVAETFQAIIQDPALTERTRQEIALNAARMKETGNTLGTKLYAILDEMLTTTKINSNHSIEGLSAKLAVYNKVSHASLRNEDGRIVQLAYFYGDDDGKSSFSNFMSNFNDAAQWTIQKNNAWVTISSKKNYPMTIYANLPLTEDDGKDLNAQAQLKAYLDENGITPRIFIHRGHSYHLENSIRQLNESTVLAVLGSCGGYKEIFEVLEKSPDAQIISTKQTGTQQINEPMIRIINNYLLNGKDLVWPQVWADIEKQVHNNKTAYEYFQQYIPPFKNTTLLMTALYEN